MPLHVFVIPQGIDDLVLQLLVANIKPLLYEPVSGG
jgi:hypothetical protein